MFRTSLLHISTVFLIVGFTAVFHAQTSWQLVTDNEAGFSVGFPGQPTYQTAIDPITGGQVEIYKFFYTGRLLRVTFAPLSGAPLTPAKLNKIYGEFSQQVVPQGGSLLRQQKLPDGGRQYDTIVSDSEGTIYGRTRFYIRNSRYYAIAFEMYARSGLNEREAERFLSSFRFLDVSPKGRNISREGALNKRLVPVKWYSLRSPDGDFTAEFPGKPTYQLDASSGASPFYRYHYFYGEDIFQVSYRESPEAVAQPEQALRRAVENYAAPQEGWRILRQERLPDRGYLIESQGVLSGSPFYSRTRLYVRGSRLYYITVLTQSLVGSNERDVSRFFASFRLS